MYPQDKPPLAELAHHGVKGMRWGVRKDQRTGVVDPVTTAIGAAYVVVMLATAIQAARQARVARDDSGRKNQKKTANVPWKQKPELAAKMSIEDIYDKVVTPVNPNYGAPGTKQNCRRATMAYEMRRRGYDVQATRTLHATGQGKEGLKEATNRELVSAWGEHAVLSAPALAQLSPAQRSDAIYNHLAQMPERARGELAVSWGFAGAHSLAWEVVDGKPIVFDAQSRTTYRDAAAFAKHTKYLAEAGYTRTDNIKLNEEFLRKWVVNV